MSNSSRMLATRRSTFPSRSLSSSSPGPHPIALSLGACERPVSPIDRAPSPRDHFSMRLLAAALAPAAASCAAKPGEQGFEWRCHYTNDRATDPLGGDSAVDNEMCIMAGFYWPEAPGLPSCFANAVAQ
jgi:hypothetical protein